MENAQKFHNFWARRSFQSIIIIAFTVYARADSAQKYFPHATLSSLFSDGYFWITNYQSFDIIWPEKRSEKASWDIKRKEAIRVSRQSSEPAAWVTTHSIIHTQEPQVNPHPFNLWSSLSAVVSSHKSHIINSQNYLVKFPFPPSLISFICISQSQSLGCACLLKSLFFTCLKFIIISNTNMWLVYGLQFHLHVLKWSSREPLIQTPIHTERKRDQVGKQINDLKNFMIIKLNMCWLIFHQVFRCPGVYVCSARAHGISRVVFSLIFLEY